MKPEAKKYIQIALATAAISGSAGFVLGKINSEVPKTSGSSASFSPGTDLAVPTSTITPGMYGPELPRPQIICDPIQIQEDLRNDNLNPDSIHILGNYNVANYFYENIFSQRVSSDGQVFSTGNPEGTDEIEEKVKEHVYNGFCIASNIDAYAGRIEANENSAIIDGVKFELNNTLEFHAAAAILANLISQVENVDSYYKELLDYEIEDLKKLKTLDLEIKIEDGSFALIPKNYLVQLSRIEQIMQSIGLPGVDTITFKKYELQDHGAGWYWKNLNTNTREIMITNNSDTNTIPHEYGHYVSEFLNGLEGYGGGMDDFTAPYEELKSLNGFPTSYDTPHQTHNGYVMNPTEEYAEAFRRYVTGYSNSYDQIQIPNMIDFENSFFNEVFGGKIFNDLGIEMKKIESDHEIMVGERFWIQGPSSYTGPTYYVNLEYPDLTGEFHNGIPGVIIGGPIFHPETGEELWQFGDPIDGNSYGYFPKSSFAKLVR